MQMWATLPTDSGMHLVWDRAQFRGISDYDTWSKELEDDVDIQRHIKLGHIVPINIQSDGAYSITVRVDPQQMPSLTGDEQRRVVVSSSPYLLNCGPELCVSGIEHVSGDPEPLRVLTGKVAPGRYQAAVHLLDYDDITQKTDEHTDFVVLLGPATTNVFRESIVTFDR
jgi:hypothetical protein